MCLESDLSVKDAVSWALSYITKHTNKMANALSEIYMHRSHLAEAMINAGAVNFLTALISHIDV